MGGIVSGIFGGGTKKAAKKSIALQKDMFAQGKELMSPFTGGGSAAFGAMGNLLGLSGGPAQSEGFNNYMNSTGYKFLLDSGSKAITGNMAAKGLRKSGATGMALEKFGQDLASTKTAEYMGMMNNMAQTGANAASGVMGAGNQMAQGVGQTRMQNANNMADAWGSVFNLAQSAAGMSDIRLKRAIEKVGEFADGLGLYIYQYITGGPVQWGVMAHEVAALRPEALGPVVDGYGSVLYGRL
jgi:hypothetical protein